MNSNFIKAYKSIGVCIQELQLYYDITDRTCAIDHEISNNLKWLIEDMKDTQTIIQVYRINTKIGHLVEDKTSKKFYIEYMDGSITSNLNCGNYIEVFLKLKGWKIGRVEYKTNGYYFYNDEVGHPKLLKGMKARLRPINE